MVSSQTIASRAKSSEVRGSVLQILDNLTEDDYLVFMREYYRQGAQRFGAAWDYADLLTFLAAAAELLMPRSFLEIGVRRGRSSAVVAANCPDCHIYGFDLWMADYAGMPNPGPQFVSEELQRLGHRGTLELISGNSHDTLPAFFAANPEAKFDLINVDGDHSLTGAMTDLECVLPHVSLGGVIVLDDIIHPQHRYLEDVWDQVVGANPDFHSYKYCELGYGVAVGIRRN
jgi:predicted O-methyltransferase YrrM